MPTPTFELFDPDGDLRVTAGNLPHWFQPGVTYFVTFRTEDSVPVELVARWRWEQSQWLARKGLGSMADLKRLSAGRQQEFHTHFSRAYHDYLDRGHGACQLRRPDIAGIVADAIRHFDGERYDLDSFVVMPNHVHALLGLRPGVDILKVCHSWKKFTATAINRLLDQSGRFWQEESFDHLVRSPEQFERARAYVAENPIRACLREGEYLLCQRP
jgi:type I restriction enzyme R subunit